MNRKRLILSLLLLAGLTLPVLATRPQPAAAGDCGVLDFVCHAIAGYAPYGEAPACTLAQVWVTGTAARHTYQYELQCSGTPFTVNGIYDVGAKRVEEKLVGRAGAWTMTASWTCVADPWIYDGGRPSCTNIDLLTRGSSLPAEAYRGKDFPVSASLLNAQ